IQVAFVVHENLRLVHEPAKRGRVDDSVAVALKLRAQGGRRLRVTAAARRRGPGGVDSQLVASFGHLSCSASAARSVASAGALVTTALPSALIRISFNPALSAFLSPRMPASTASGSMPL